MLKLQIHSLVGLITNSSSVIYTYQYSMEEAKELIQEILKLSGVTIPVEELFSFGVFCDKYGYLRIMRKLNIDELDDVLVAYVEEGKIEELFERIAHGEIKRPEWFAEAESDDSGDYHAPSLYLWIFPKREEYVPLAEKLLAFLNSPDHEGGYDG